MTAPGCTGEGHLPPEIAPALISDLADRCRRLARDLAETWSRSADYHGAEEGTEELARAARLVGQARIELDRHRTRWPVTP